MVKCKECGKEFKNDRGLHAHIKLHKLKVQDYYYKHFPRKDLHTGEFITFKNKDQYLNSDFNKRLSSPGLICVVLLIPFLSSQPSCRFLIKLDNFL